MLKLNISDSDSASTSILRVQYNTIQCESLVGQVAHTIFFICGRASLLVGAFTQVGRCSWIVGYCAFGLCSWVVNFGLVIDISYIVWVSWMLCHVLS